MSKESKQTNIMVWAGNLNKTILDYYQIMSLDASNKNTAI